jgi:hypothetical protein
VRCFNLENFWATGMNAPVWPEFPTLTSVTADKANCSYILGNKIYKNMKIFVLIDTMKR